MDFWCFPALLRYASDLIDPNDNSIRTQITFYHAAKINEKAILIRTSEPEIPCVSDSISLSPALQPTLARLVSRRMKERLHIYSEVFKLFQTNSQSTRKQIQSTSEVSCERASRSIGQDGLPLTVHFSIKSSGLYETWSPP